MKMIVTGGAGFIGTNFMLYMTRFHPDYKLVCVDKLTYASHQSVIRRNIDNPNFRFVNLDISDKAAVFAVVAEERPDSIINFAAETHVDRSIQDPYVFVQSNILGTMVMLDACRRFGVKRFHQVSTDEVYGDLPLDRPDLLFDEDSLIRPSSPYSASKASADMLVMAYHRTYGLPVTISRYSNNYGPYQTIEKLIPLTIVNCLKDKPIPIYGKGTNIRDWLHVSDHCRAIDLIIHDEKSGEIYNLGGHCEMRNIDVVKLICSVLGKPVDLITYVPDRIGHDLRYAVDTKKANTVLKWNPNRDFKTGLKETIRWYQKKPSFWENKYVK